MIIFKTIRWKNLLSTGNAFTEIKLNRSPSTLIVGENGGGKSTLLDALCFGLFGKPFRSINKPQLLNSINKKNLLVEIEFDIGGKDYKIVRGIKPNIFEIQSGGEVINQDAAARDYQKYLEESVLKLNYKSFTQIVILGSASFTPFMQLKSAERRKLVEDLLDISIFSTMKDILRKKVSAHKIELKETNHEVELIEERVSGLNEQLQALRETRELKIKKYEGTVQETQDNIDTLLEKVGVKEEDVVNKLETISDRDPQGDRLKQAEAVEQQLITARKKALKEIEFYENHDDCPTCKQGLDHEHKTKHIEEKKLKSDEIKEALLQLDTTLENTRNRLAEITEVQREIESIQKQKGLLQTEILSNQKFITKIQKEIEELKIEQNVSSNVHERIEESEDTLEILHQKHKTLVDQGHYFDIASTLLRDQGVKEKIIKQYVPVMNKMINKYLAQLEFYVGFELNESFEETIKSRFRDVFSYSSFSEGEKLRIDLALLFTWRAVAKLRNSVSTNLLIMDEIMDSSLDTSGTEEFLKIIQDLTADSNIFIISHKGDQLFDKFHSVIRFEKVKNFSRIAQ